MFSVLLPLLLLPLVHTSEGGACQDGFCSEADLFTKCQCEPCKYVSHGEFWGTYKHKSDPEVNYQQHIIYFQFTNLIKNNNAIKPMKFNKMPDLKLASIQQFAFISIKLLERVYGDLWREYSYLKINFKLISDQLISLS